MKTVDTAESKKKQILKTLDKRRRAPLIAMADSTWLRWRERKPDRGGSGRIRVLVAHNDQRVALAHPDGVTGCVARGRRGSLAGDWRLCFSIEAITSMFRLHPSEQLSGQVG